MTRDYAALEVDGVYVDAWTSYSFASDLFTPADSFSLGLGVGSSSSRELKANIARLKGLLAKGKEVKLWVGADDKRALQGYCIIDGAEIGNDADSGTTLKVEGRDRAQHLVDSAADPKLYASNDTLVAVARKACEPWGIEVTADHIAARDLRQAKVNKDRTRRLQQKARALGLPPSLMSDKIALSIDKGTISLEDFVAAADVDLTRLRASRLGIPNSGGLPGLSSLAIYQLRVKEVRPQSGESRWEYLDRQARRNGLLMRMSPDGKLVFCGMQYNQEPSYRLTRRIEGDRSANNVLSGGWREDISGAYKTVIVYGRVKGDDHTRSPFKGIAEDKAADAVPFEKTLVLHDNSIKSKADAQTRAEYELGKSKQGSLVLSYTVAGHSADGLFFATDTVAQVEDEVIGVNGPYYLTSRTLARNPGTGPTTEVRLVPLGSIVLKEAA